MHTPARFVLKRIFRLALLLLFSFLDISFLPVCSYDPLLSLKAFFLAALKRRGHSLFFPIKEKFFRPPKKDENFYFIALNIRSPIGRQTARSRFATL